MLEKHSSNKPVSPASSKKLHKRLQHRAVIGIAITSLIIGGISSILLFRAHTKHLKTELLFQMELQTVVLESEISRLKNLATQITSRSRIRQELEKYLRNEIKLESLNNFSQLKLADAMNLASDMVSIYRLDNNGKLLIQVGSSVPEQLWPKEFLSETVQLGIPQEVDGQQLLVLSAPIFNRQGKKVGTDLVTFDIQHIIDIIKKFTHHQQANGNVRIVKPSPEGVMYIYRTDKTSDTGIEQLINEKMEAVLTGEYKKLHQISSAQKSLIMAHREIGDTGWVYFFFDHADNFFAPARINATYVSLSILMLTLIGTILTLLLVRPLSTRISDETNTVHRLLQEHDKLLSKIQLSETRLQSILDNASSVIYVKDREGRYLLTNNRFDELFGKSHEEIINKTDFDIFPKEMADIFRENDLRVFEQETPLTLDEQAPHNDGIHHYISIKFPLHDETGNIYGVCGISTDITERKQAEKALHASDERFRLAMLATNDGLWDWNIKTNVVYYSPRWMAMLGYEDHELKNDFSTWEQLVDADDQVKTLALIEECLSGQQDGFKTEHRMRHKQGHWVHILAQGLLVRNNKGEPERFVGTHTDISERVAAEMALKNSESHLRAMFEFAQDGILLTDIETGKIVDANPAFCNMLGYDRDQLTTMRIEAIHPEAELTEVMAEFETRARGITDELAQNIPVLCKDGSVFPADINVSLLEIDKRTCMLGFFRDITERKQAEKALEDYRDNLEEQVIVRTRELEDLTHYNRTLFETTPIGLALCDMEGNLVDVNSAYLNIIGYTEAEAKALSYWDITPLDYEPQEKIQLETLEKTGRYGPYEKEYRHKDGHLTSVQLSGLIIEQNGKQYIWSSVEDITERKASETALTDAKQKAETAARVKSEFLANMSHEIRTPLNAVLGLARMGKRSTSPEKTHEIFEWISESGQNLFRVVNDILDFSKIEAGKLTLENQPFNLRTSIKNTTNLIKTQVEDKGLSLVLDIADDLPSWVKGDALRLEQILLNLLSNAVKFTEKGEITLRILQHKTGLQFQVSDTGIGMSERQLEQLFKPFEQADSSTTRRYGGTGLGLSISHNLAKMMGGNIQVQSQTGKGSNFILNLELEATAAVIEFSCKTSSATGQRLQGTNILAAEDIELNRLVLDDMLTREGARVSFAENGQQALNILEEQGINAFDIVLMDIQMPVMDGYETTQHISNIAPVLPIIGLTAHALAEEKKRCLAVGMVDHVAKPVEVDDLIMAIQKQISPSNKQRRTATQKSAINTNNKITKLQIPKEADDVIDWPALQTRYQGRDALIKKLITVTLRTHNETPGKLRQAVLSKDVDTLHLTSHSLKGMAGFLEAAKLHKLATRTEEETLDNNTDNIQIGNELAEVMEKLLTRLSDIMG